MGRLEEMKERYDNIVIPAELNVRIQQEISKSRKQQAKKNNTSNCTHYMKIKQEAI